MDKGSNWGDCPLRYFGWAENNGVVLGLSYICSKNGSLCDPHYCLGPDEDKKGDENGSETV